MRTGVRVDGGIYALIRHPQGGAAWLLPSRGVMRVAWHWTSRARGLVSMAPAYLDTFQADQYAIAQLGSAYRVYIERVPRLNAAFGLVNWLWRRAG